MAAKFSMSGRADYGDATTVGLIEELADLIEQAEALDAAIFRRLKPEQAIDYETQLTIVGGFPDVKPLRAYAAAWQARLDAEVSDE